MLATALGVGLAAGALPSVAGAGVATLVGVVETSAVGAVDWADAACAAAVVERGVRLVTMDFLP